MDSKVSRSPVLDSILESKSKEVEESRRARSAASLVREIAGMPHPFPLYREWARTRGTGVKVIAEVKQKSPSRGILRDPYEPGAIAASYAKAGAKGISVLTDRPFFGGQLGHLAVVRDALGSDSRIPILRKDFLIDPYQVWESRHAGADIVLFIVRILEDALLKDMISQSHALGLSALVEVHSERDLERALDAGAVLVGVNHRDLDRLSMDLTLSERLAPLMPDLVLRVAESGLKSSRDRVRMGQLGYDAVLVGESFLSEDEPGKALERFLVDVD